MTHAMTFPASMLLVATLVVAAFSAATQPLAATPETARAAAAFTVASR